MGLPISLFRHGGMFDQISLPEGYGAEVARRADAWLVENQIQVGGTAVRATHIETEKGYTDKVQLEPPIDDATARRLGRHLINSDDGIQIGPFVTMIDDDAARREDRPLGNITSTHVEPVDLAELGAGDDPGSLLIESDQEGF